MTKFQKFQRYSSIIPFFSTVFVFAATMIELKRKRVSIKSWVLFSGIFFTSGVALYLLNAVILSGLHSILNFAASGLLLSITNILCVELQLKSKSKDIKSDNHLPKPSIFIVVILGVTVVGVIAALVFLFLPSVDIADTNGVDDSRLSVLTLDELLLTNDNYSAFGMNYTTDGNNSMVEKKLEVIDYDTCSYNFEKISGTKTLHATKVNSDTLTINICSTLVSGNAEIVVIIDGEYYTHVAVGQKQSLVLNQISGKLVAVKLGAESANLSISVSRSVS